MITLQDIHAALSRIRDSIYLSPCARSETFSQSTGNQVYLKLDNLQRTGAFKERGALNKLLTLTQEERARGVAFFHSPQAPFPTFWTPLPMRAPSARASASRCSRMKSPTPRPR